MSYPDIPRFATSATCRFDWRVYRFEKRGSYKEKKAPFCRKTWLANNVEARREQRRRWALANPTYDLIRHPVSYDASGLGIGLESILMTEQKSPLELLMEKEEADLAA